MSGGESELVLALAPCSRGFAFALFESPLSPVDWGVKEFRGNDWHTCAIAAVKQIVARHQPEVLVLKTQALRFHRPWHRAVRLQRSIHGYALEQAIAVHRFSGEEIRECFQDAGAITQYQIAQTIAGHIPAFAPHLPPKRAPWTAEHPRMRLFEAVALVETYYCNCGRDPRPSA